MSSRLNGRATAAASRSRFSALAVCLALLAAPTPPVSFGATGPATRPRGVMAAMSRYERNLLTRVNGLRARHNRVSLVPSPGLTASAEVHTRRMLREGFFEHEAPGERPFWRRIARYYPSAGYDYWAVGENLAYGSPGLSPAEVVHEWLESRTHRRSLLTREWREIGLAAVQVETAPGEFDGEPATVVTLDLGVRRG